MQPRRQGTAITIAALLALGTVACGGDDGGTTNASSASATGAAERTSTTSAAAASAAAAPTPTTRPAPGSTGPGATAASTTTRASSGSTPSFPWPDKLKLPADFTVTKAGLGAEITYSGSGSAYALLFAWAPTVGTIARAGERTGGGRILIEAKPGTDFGTHPQAGTMKTLDLEIDKGTVFASFR